MSAAACLAEMVTVLPQPFEICKQRGLRLLQAKAPLTDCFKHCWHHLDREAVATHIDVPSESGASIGFSTNIYVHI